MKTFSIAYRTENGRHRARIRAGNVAHAFEIFTHNHPNREILSVDRWHESILEIDQANRAIGQSWFGVAEMRVFQSRVHDAIYGGRFFVTSEKGPDGIRRYTVREALQTGEIGTVGEFQQYVLRNAAHAAAQRAATS